MITTTEPPPITGNEDTVTATPCIRALINFYNAFNSRDIAKMSENWATGEDVTMDNPVGGIKRGWEEIKAVYERIFNGPARVYVEFYDYTIHSSHDIFYAVGRERGEFRLGEKALKLQVRTSRIYRLIGGQWQQVHHHGSIDDADTLKEYQAVVNKTR